MNPMPETTTINQRAEWGYLKGFLEQRIDDFAKTDSVFAKKPGDLDRLLDYLGIDKVIDLPTVEQYRSEKSGALAEHRVFSVLGRPGVYITQQKRVTDNDWGTTALRRLGSKADAEYRSSLEPASYSK